MDTNKAAGLAVALMKRHCPDYYFEWDNAKRRCGQCNYRRKVISLSKPVTELNSEEDVRDTILHEIAHAVVGSGNGHNWRWKAACRELGAKPTRCADEHTIMPKGRYAYECSNCKRQVTYHRRKRRPTACGVCCKRYNNNRFSSDYLLTFEGEII